MNINRHEFQNILPSKLIHSAIHKKMGKRHEDLKNKETNTTCYCSQLFQLSIIFQDITATTIGEKHFGQ